MTHGPLVGPRGCAALAALLALLATSPARGFLKIRDCLSPIASRAVPLCEFRMETSRSGPVLRRMVASQQVRQPRKTIREISPVSHLGGPLDFFGGFFDG